MVLLQQQAAITASFGFYQRTSESFTGTIEIRSVLLGHKHNHPTTEAENYDIGL
jgi:hypothetical protein